MMKLLSRPVYTTVLTLLLLACHRFLQLSDCAKLSSASTPMEKAAVFPSAHRHDDAREDDDACLPSMEPMVVGDVDVGSSRTNDAADLALAAPPSSDATPVQQGKEDEGVGSGPGQQQRPGAPRTALLLRRSRLPRRFLAVTAGLVEELGTDGARPSCHSHDVRISCPPPSKR